MGDYILGCTVRGVDYDFRKGDDEDSYPIMYRNGKLVCDNYFAFDSLSCAVHDIAFGHIEQFKFASREADGIASMIEEFVRDLTDEEKEEVWF